MTLSGWFFILVCSFVVIVANLLLREGVVGSGIVLFRGRIADLPADLLHLATQPMLVGSMALYGTALLIWFRLVATQPISIAYPALATLTFVGITTAGIIFFAEPVTFQKMLGLGFALIGLVLIYTS